MLHLSYDILCQNWLQIIIFQNACFSLMKQKRAYAVMSLLYNGTVFSRFLQKIPGPLAWKVLMMIFLTCFSLGGASIKLKDLIMALFCSNSNRSRSYDKWNKCQNNGFDFKYDLQLKEDNFTWSKEVFPRLPTACGTRFESFRFILLFAFQQHLSVRY